MQVYWCAHILPTNTLIGLNQSTFQSIKQLGLSFSEPQVVVVQFELWILVILDDIITNWLHVFIHELLVMPYEEFEISLFVMIFTGVFLILRLDLYVVCRALIVKDHRI